MRQAFWKSSLYLLAALVCAAPLVVLFALPWIDLGIFRQVETVAVAIHTLSALIALGLMGVSIARPEALRGAVGAPALALLGLSGVAFALSPFATEPSRSWHGSLEHGVGAIWFAELALFSIAATVLRKEFPKAFRAAVYVGAATVLGCVLLEVLSLPYGGERFVPYDFKGYLGFTALLAAVPLLALHPKGRLALVVVAALFCVAVFGNRTAALTILAAVAFWGLGRAAVARFRPALAIASAVVLVGTLLVMGGLAGFVDSRFAGAPKVAGIPSERGLDHVAVQLTPYGTLWQRSVTEGMVWDALLSSPRRLLTGMGFGAFETVAIGERAEAPGRRFVTPTTTSALAYWDGDQKAKFHSHNLWLEALLSAGVLGAAAWLAFVLSIPFRSSRAALPAASLLLAVLTVSGSLWFFVNSALPLLALALAATGPSLRLPKALRPVSAADAGATAAFALALAAFGLFAAASFASAKGQILERFFPPQIAGPNGPACQGFSAVTMPNEQINVNLYRMFVRRVEDRKELAMVELAPRLGNAANFSCMMRNYGSVEAMEASLAARSRLNAALGAGNPIMERALGPDFAYWQSDLDRWLEKAPGRTDMVIHYLAWLGAKGDKSRLIQAVDHFVGKMDEGDPVRAYALSVKAREQGNVAEAQALARKAFALGIANLIPVSEQVRSALVGGAGVSP